MAKIPLRTYNKEIEKLIENGQTQEAVAHCRHILKFFPKYVDTYRTLGNAFLEGRHYSEAVDVFQRVLSVLPDDFNSHLGMSIIRGDENDLDGAIFHMEKAFEVRPANAAVQEELRTLYGRRDGVKPPKIRLTRGALVRMYMRGELYNQAIAEIRSTLADDPNRVDLQVLLADLYFKAGQFVQAAEAAGTLIAKLPYCYKANKILARVLPGTARSEDASVYLERLKAVDPYTAFLSEGSDNSEDVSDAAVQIERLEYDPASAQAELPEWTRTVGVAWDESEEAVMPDWLSGQTTPSTPDEIVKEDSNLEGQVEAGPPPAAAIPDWMETAGWAPSSGVAEESLTHLEETGSDDTEAVPGEIPDWLQSIAPEAAAAVSPDLPQEDVGWAEKLFGETPDQVSEQIENQPEAELPIAETPLDVVSEVSDSEESAAPIEEAELPDWLVSMKSEDTAAPAETEQETLPDWLQSVESTSNTIAAEKTESLPDWLQTPNIEESTAAADVDSLQGIEAAPTSENLETVDAEQVVSELADTQIEPAVEKDTFDAMPLVDGTAFFEPDNSIEEVEVQQSVSEEIAAPAAQEILDEVAQVQSEPIPEENMDAAMAWLEALAAKQGADEGTLSTEPDQRQEEMPEWLRKASLEEIKPAETVEPVLEMETSTEPTVEPVLEMDNEPAAEMLLGVEDQSEIPEGNVPEQESTPAMESVSEPAEMVGEIPAEIIDQSQTPEVEAAEQPVASESSQEIDDAMAWLESLAARQGADEGTLLVNPEDRLETAPEWINALPEEPVETAPSMELPPAPEESPAAEIITPDQMMPAEIAAADAVPPIQTETVEPVATEESETTDAEWNPAESAVTNQPLEETPLPDWLQNIDSYSESDQTAAEGVDAGEEEALPEWLQGLESITDQLEPEIVAPSSEWVPEETAEIPQTVETMETASEIQAAIPEPATELPAVEKAEELPVMVPAGDSSIDGLRSTAQKSLEKGNIDAAVESYSTLINEGQLLDETVHDLREAIDRYPVNTVLWQALGDAYRKSNRLQDALDAYTKAIELLR